MDHNLDDSLNLDSAMGVEFETHEDAVDSQTDMALGTVEHDAGLPMDFEPIEEQQMLMDTQNEEIINYMGDQFPLEYSVQDDQTIQTSSVDTAVVENEAMMSHTDTMLDIQFDPQSIVSTAPSPAIQPQVNPKIVSVKAALPPRTICISKKPDSMVLNTMPRQVAIAPKPPAKLQAFRSVTAGKQFAIAPKPVALMANKNSLVKKVTIAGVVQGCPPGKTVLAQFGGKQFVMVPSAGAQKIKLVGGVPNIQYVRANSDQVPLKAQLITAKNVTGTSKPVLTKYIVQGQSSDPSNQPAVITKLMPAGGAMSSVSGVSGGAAPARYVTMHQKTVPISMPNKVSSKIFVSSSPSKQQTVKITKKQSQIVEIKSPNTKFIPISSAGSTTKKVVITATPAQNVILKTTAPPKTPQINKDGNVVVHGQRTQLHQINVPGKGIQYIRLVTNPSAPRAKPVSSPRPQNMLTTSKTIVLADTKVTSRPQQRLVKIAPVGSKPALAATQLSSARPSQSLLAPLSPPSPPSPRRVPPRPSPGAPPAGSAGSTGPEASGAPGAAEEPDADCKAALKALLQDRMDDVQGLTTHEVEVEFERRQSPIDENTSSMDHLDNSNEQHYRNNDSMEQPLIVIPSTYLKPTNQDTSGLTDEYSLEESKRFENLDSFNSFQEPQTPQALSDSDMVSNELGMRPRKACNCTKSQCLKLYCDCFANGEFCNRCNCNNCHNNLENEELRQKAIRGCLDRNPNAFRPKIGKAKSGGPDIVRRHNKGCNCKRSGCLKNYCECYEAKIACTAMCKCVGCRNVEESLERRRRDALRDAGAPAVYRPPALPQINFMTSEVIEAVCQCLIAAAVEDGGDAAGGGGGARDGAAGRDAGAARRDAGEGREDADPVRDVIDEFARCLQDIINAAHQAAPIVDESLIAGADVILDGVKMEKT